MVVVQKTGRHRDREQMSVLPSFPLAQQAQIIRANQRDLYHVSSLKDQFEGVLRAWLGTRWLSRWEKEVNLLVKLVYYGLTTVRATQTLGEEYTDIWQYSTLHGTFPPPPVLRAALVLLPTIPGYLLTRLDDFLPQNAISQSWRKWLKRLPSVLEILTELNLAAFYIQGVYYDLVKRALGIRKISSTPHNPNVRPPSYSLLGILLGNRKARKENIAQLISKTKLS
ncbi:Peroxisome assembly protein PER8 [Mycena indigotica]|uniref:RING-type E3 ubiquitin transferase n=1 Tax=Mycena indigotica TaxID=2126181 RepID=A0A8H6SZ02_9AGAR|nr:Peroxisome assembly protein PER8 [Mycena indigotica]KAF7306490.1 Peroxisome assembly protein PER8 [Mycena indigotica]